MTGKIEKYLSRVINTPNHTEVEEGLDFILSHFNIPLYPRSLSTKATDGRQVNVNSKEEALAYFRATKYLDCRISAFLYWRPSTISSFAGIKNTIKPDLIMIDLDRCNFENERALKLALTKTLNNIRQKLGAKPTVIWSGNGYHIYIPIRAEVLEDIKQFADIEQVSVKFLRFSEWHLSNGKSDRVHNNTVSLANCMLRVPGSYNSKEHCTNPEVRIVKRWNGWRPNINLLLGSFCAYLADKKIKKEEETKRRWRQQRQQKQFSDTNHLTVMINNEIIWIEKLLQTPIQDHRKYAIWRILAPYLLNVKKLSYKQASDIIKDWLDRCSNLKRLSFIANQKIKDGLNGTKGYFPISFEELKTECNDIYNELVKN